MDIDHIKQRLAVPMTRDAQYGDQVLNPEFADGLVTKTFHAAAVLIPLIKRADGLSVVLTKRSATLRAHGGQVAFPGGRIDPDDGSATIAALREAEEEIALPRQHVETIGTLPDYLTGSGYRITPIIGFINHEVILKPNPNEVDVIFEVPLAHLLAPDNHFKSSRVLQGRARYFYEIPHSDHYIWGVTAGIIRMFYERVTL